MDAAAILAASIGGIPAIIAAIFAYKSSANANEVSVKKVDAEAYERSQQFYEKLLSEADRQLERLRVQVDRLNDQVDKVNTQLATEQDVSNVLRNQVRMLTTQVSTMEAMLNEVRLGMTSSRPGASLVSRMDPPTPRGSHQ
jgi:peptidoglycan hydrolase CwlO-like protein